MGGNLKPVNFVFKDQDWDLYTQHRPPYPQAVFDHIYKYHQKHNGEFKQALDIGAGNGIVTKNLIQYFDHVTFSDIGEQYVQQAKQRFSSVGSEKLSYLQAGFYDLEPEKLPDGGLDLVAGATCLHFLGAQRDTFPPRMAKLIKPGGTFAAIQYGGLAVFPEDEPGHTEFNAVFFGLIDYFNEHFENHTTDGPGALMNSRFDYLDLDPQTWEHVRRLHAWYDKPAVSPLMPESKSHVRNDVESVENFHDQAIVSKDADYEWIHGYYVNLYPAMDTATICKDQLAALKQVMGDKIVKVQWPFDLVLATRK